MKTQLHIWLLITLSVIVFSTTGFAEQIKFGDWLCIEAADPAAKGDSKRIGTFAGDGISSLWLARSAYSTDQIQLTLKSKKTIVSDYFSFRIDNIDTLTLRSALKGCNANCLTDEVPKNDELIKNMRSGLLIKFEYDSVPDITQKSTFSLRGFSRAYNWLLSK